MKNYSKGKNIFILVIVLVLLTSQLAWASNIYTPTPQPEALRGGGVGLVWMSFVEGNWEIYHMELVGGKITRITNDLSNQGYPDLWREYIVWQDHGNRLDGGSDIILFNTKTGVGEKISNLEGNHQTPIVVNNKVVWINDYNGKRIVMAYDMRTATAQVISSQNAQAYGLDFDGETVVWMEGRDHVINIYMAQLENGVEKQITYGLQNAVDPLVSNGKVIYRVNHNGIDQIYMYEISSGYTTRLTAGFENHLSLAFNGESLIMKKGNDLVYSNVSNIVESPIKTVGGGIPNQAILVGDTVTWLEGGKIATESVNSGLERAIPKEEDIINPPNLGGSIEEANGEAVNRRLIKAAEENQITFDEGKVTFLIPKGSFLQDTYINFHRKEPFIQKDYRAISDTYSWDFEGEKPLLPIQLVIKYSLQTVGESPKKICGYDLSKEPKPVATLRNYEEGSHTFEVKGDGKVALLIFNKSFKDMGNHWANEVVEVIASHQIIGGYSDGSFRPNQNMTRAEFVKILVSGLYIETEEVDGQIFKDVPVGFWATPYIHVAHEKGWILGHEGNFNPNGSITRQEMITILMRIYQDLKGEELSPSKKVDLTTYIDHGKISSWALEPMEGAVAMGLVEGFNNQLAPTKKATRAEAATLLYRYLEKLGRL